MSSEINSSSFSMKVAESVYNHPARYIVITILALAILAVGVLGFQNIQPLDRIGIPACYGLMSVGGLATLTILALVIRGLTYDEEGRAEHGDGLLS